MKFFSALVTACLLSVGSGAHAAFMAFICDDMLCTGGGDTIVTDQGAGDNFPGSAFVGQINSGAINSGGFTIVTNVAQSKPLIGSAAAPQLGLAFTAVTNDNLAHTVYLYATDTGFTGSGQGFLTLGGTQFSGINSVRGGAWGGTSNSNFDLSNLLLDTGAASNSPFTLNDSELFSPTVNPYGLTIGVMITREGAGSTTGDLNLRVSAVTAVAEPPSLLLAGISLLALVGARRRARG